MLIGTGVDLIEVERIAQFIERFGVRFLRRVFTEQEIAYCSPSVTVRRASPHGSRPKRRARRLWEPGSAWELPGTNSRWRGSRAGGRFRTARAGRAAGQGTWGADNLPSLTHTAAWPWPSSSWKARAPLANRRCTPGASHLLSGLANSLFDMLSPSGENPAAPASIRGGLCQASSKSSGHN